MSFGGRSQNAQGGGTTFDVFVGNLTIDITEKVLTKHFSQFGQVHSLVILDTKNGSGKMSFVRFYTENDAEQACKAHNTLEVNGKKLAIRMAARRSPSGMINSVNKRTPNMPKGKVGRDFSRKGQESPSGDVADRRSLSSESDISSSSDERVVVSHVENAICLWVQPITEASADDLVKMSEELGLQCPTAPKLCAIPSVNKMYATRFSQDGLWYRCKSKTTHSGDRVTVQFVDFGNTEEKDTTDLVEIPPMLADKKPFARKLVLSNLVMKSDYDREPAIQYLREQVEGKVLKARFMVPLRDGSGNYGDLYMNGKGIAEMVLGKGYAIHRSMLPPRSGNFAQSSANSWPDSDRESEPQQVTMNTQFQSNMVEKDKLHRTEVSNYKMNLEKEKAEKDMLTLELATLKGKLKNVQADYAAMCIKVVDNNVGHKVLNIVNLTEKVRKLRAQFPTDGRSTDILSTSLDLATDEGKVSLDSITSLQAVNATLEAYTSAQQAIRGCTDQLFLSELIESRDTRRQELYTSLEKFVKEASRMPLDERAEKVQVTLDIIESSYSGFLMFIVNKYPGIDEAQTLYTKWKTKIVDGYNSVRAETNSCQRLINSTLGQLQTLISLEDGASVVDPNVDLENLFQHYILALQHEIESTDVLHSGDACLVATVIHEIKKVFQDEMKIIANVRQLSQEFTRQMTMVEDWLDNKPDLEEIRNIRKNLRTMKSKLRHLLADKEDLLDTEDACADERNCLDEELKVLRKDLHETLLNEESLLITLAEVADIHFPELKILHPDLSLDAYLKYKGLLKTGREVEQYDLVPAFGQTGLYQVTFAEKTAILKEHLIEDKIHVCREEFLARAMDYSRLDSPNLAPLQAVFFSKNQRQVFVQSGACGVPLSELMRSEELRPWELQYVLRCVTEALVVLHMAGLTHGSLSPQSVLVTEDRSAVLQMPDFSRPVVDPSRAWYVSQTGLEFRAPEEDQGQPPSPTTDLYCLGLLYLWTHLPFVGIDLKGDGTPDLQSQTLEEPLCLSIQSLVRSTPSDRMSASTVLQCEYHQQTIPVQADTASTGDAENSILDSPTEDIHQPSLFPLVLTASQTDDLKTESANTETTLDAPVIIESESSTQLEEKNMGALLNLNGTDDEPQSPGTLPIGVWGGAEKKAISESVVNLVSRLLLEDAAVPPTLGSIMDTTGHFVDEEAASETLPSADSFSSLSDTNSITGATEESSVMAVETGVENESHLNLIAHNGQNLPAVQDSKKMVSVNGCPANAAASEIGYMHGGGDAKDAKAGEPTLVTDNAQLLQNLLNFTAEH